MTNGKKELYSEFGEMLFTHFGVTGPLILSASAHIPDINSTAYEARIDLKPALDEKTLDNRLLSDFSKYANKDFIYALCDTLFEMDSMTYGCNSYVYDDTILENLTMGTAKIYTALLLAIPVLISAVGAILIIRRKNR